MGNRFSIQRARHDLKGAKAAFRRRFRSSYGKLRTERKSPEEKASAISLSN
jgi:hypothetical protein